MKKIALLCAASLSLAGVHGAANATTYRPAGAGSMSGTMVTTVAGVTTTCTLSVGYNVANNSSDGHTAFTNPSGGAEPLGTDPSHGHSVSVTSFALSGAPGCSLATITGTPVISVNAAGTVVTISNIQATAIGGLIQCNGSINGSYNHTNKSVTFVNQTIGSCTFSGTISALHIDPNP